MTSSSAPATVPAVTDAAADARPFLSSTSAQLFVADIAASCRFYTSLGFAVDFVYGEPPFYGQVSRDNARLALRVVGAPVFAGDIREREQLLAGSITVDTAADIKRLFQDFQSTGAEFHQPLAPQPWGALNFILRDPDGNLVLFAGPGA